MRFVAAYAALILFAAPATQAAEVQELFAPPVGTVLDYHSKTVGKQGTADPRTFEVDVRRKVVENDELTAKMTYDQSNFVLNGAAAPNAAIGPTDAYLVYRLYSLAENSSVTKMQEGQARHVVQDFNCDKAGLQSFLPLGRLPLVTVRCKLTTSVNDEASQPTYADMNVSYEGRSVLASPAGKFRVANIRMVYDAGQTHVENFIEIDTDKGVLVHSEQATTAPSFSSTAVTDLKKIE